MARCKGCEHVRGVTLALRTNGRTRSLPNRYCGSKIAISPSFVCQRTFFYLGDACEVADEFLLPLLPPASPPTPAAPHAPKAASPRRCALRPHPPHCRLPLDPKAPIAIEK